jgi:hypothetical protein
MTIEQISKQVEALVTRMVEDARQENTIYKYLCDDLKGQVEMMLDQAKENKDASLRVGLSLTTIELEGYQRALQQVMELFEEG